MEIQQAFELNDADDAVWTPSDVIDIYRAAFQAPPYNKPDQEIEAFAMQFSDHQRRRGFRFFAALENQQLAGFIYGYDLWYRRWLYQQLQPYLQDTPWLTNCYQIVEFAVHPDFQGQGVGSRLHNALIDTASGYSRYLLCTLASESAAMHLYRRNGWEILLDNHQFPGAARLYRVLGNRFKK